MSVGDAPSERPQVSGPAAADLLERLRRQPGGEELLMLAPPGAFLVGGAVRDLLLDRRPRELDVLVEGESSPLGHCAALLAGALAGSFGILAGTNDHERFGTVIVDWGAGRIDIATARRERYPAPGALPVVEPAPLAEDLLRRDFTINALALALDGERPGELHAAPNALEDLHAGRPRVLHQRSFLDDPTRLWRLARYRARLGFAVEEQTWQLASCAVAEGALHTVSGARIGAELRRALAEPDPLATLAETDRLGLLGALHSRLRLEAPLARRALELLPAGGEDRPDLLLLATLTLPLALRVDGDDPRMEIVALLDRLEFPAAERDRVAAAAAAVARLVDELPRTSAPSQLRALVLAVPPEGIALAGALTGAPGAEHATRWLTELRHMRLQISGDDLLEAGMAPGPDIGRRLETVLNLHLDGEVPADAQAQLAAALRV